jgi:cell division protein FtsW (lipid II flippase)
MLDQALERLDLTTLHTVLTLVGALMALYVMQLTSHEREDDVDPSWLRWVRRGGLGAIALALLWSLNYSETKSWQPWPPEIALIIAIILTLIVRAAAIHARIWREGSRRRRSSTPVTHRIRN